MGTSCISGSKQAKDPNPKTHSATQQIKRKYNIQQKVLGSGSFGKVFLAEASNDSTFKVAIKAIPKKKIGKNLK